MTDQLTPTREGLRRFPETAGYNADYGLACTCESGCDPRCAGECGCAACRTQFIDFCDYAGALGPDGLEISENEALRRYRNNQPR